MRNEKGVTLASLAIYIVVATLLIGGMATISSLFFSNVNLIKGQEAYAPQFTKFNMFFIQDVKNNQIAIVNGNKITFEDGTVYTYDQGERAIYRNQTKIAELVQNVNYTSAEVRTPGTSTTKQVITVKMTIGTEESEFPSEIAIEYVLKYW